MALKAILITVWAREIRFERFIKFVIFVLVDDIYQGYIKTFSVIGVKLYYFGGCFAIRDFG